MEIVMVAGVDGRSGRMW